MFLVKKEMGRASYKTSTSFQSLEKEGEDLLGSKAKLFVAHCLTMFLHGASAERVTLNLL